MRGKPRPSERELAEQLALLRHLARTVLVKHDEVQSALNQGKGLSGLAPYQDALDALRKEVAR